MKMPDSFAARASDEAFDAFRLGGAADFFVTGETEEELLALVTLASNRGMAYLLLGAGSNILVGDVWMLAGQSNMQGIGDLVSRLQPINQVRAYYMHDVWQPAEDPIYTFLRSLNNASHMINRIPSATNI